MTNYQIERLLERTVAEALGVELPAKQRRRTARAAAPVVKASHRRHKEIVAELHPA